MKRPALRHLLTDIEDGKVDVVVVYKIDRLSRSLADFARMIDVFDRYGVSFVSVTQQFNTTISMGRLTLNILLSFAQFEREVMGECIRDKFAASKAKGMWMGGVVPLGYRVENRQLLIQPDEAKVVRRRSCLLGTNAPTTATRPWRGLEFLLAGLVETDAGEKLHTTFTTNREGKHYTYYVPKRMQTLGERHALGRIPAGQLDDVVLAQIHSALKTLEMVQAILVGQQPRTLSLI